MSIGGGAVALARRLGRLALRVARRSEESTKPSDEALRSKSWRARSWHYLAAAEREALAAVSCCVVQRCCKCWMKVKSAARLFALPRATPKVRSANQGTGRGVIATVKMVEFQSGMVSRAEKLSTALQVARWARERRHSRMK
eukprot:1391065-Pleurochrysis_carterae.AAC.2